MDRCLTPPGLGRQNGAWVEVPTQAVPHAPTTASPDTTRAGHGRKDATHASNRNRLGFRLDGDPADSQRPGWLQPDREPDRA
jgi:hypothetical protein